VALALLAGCTGQQRDAGNYEDTEEAYLEGCILRAEEDVAEGGAEIADPEAWCQCTFDAIAEQVEFDVFRDANSDLREEGGDLPSELVDASAACDPSSPEPTAG
jgi:hypothetical protein